MSLETFRAELQEVLSTTTEETEDDALRAIDNWFTAYKMWEETDTFANALREKRLTVRTMKFVTEHTPLSMTRTSEPEKGKQEFSGTTSRTGIRGLTMRMDPANFVGDESGLSSKYTLGLHDMSASLLHPQRTIGHQLYGWGFRTDSDAVTRRTKSYYVVFVPLPKVEDMATFGLLTKVAKGLGRNADTLYATMRNVRAQMTRIKYADKDDSHIGFADISLKDSARPKFRYGLKNSDAEKGVVDSDTRLARAAAAQQYTSILETAKERALRVEGNEKNKFYNEIIVAYRSHASPDFPLFARWVDPEFRVVTMNDLGTGMTDDPSRTISDTGQTTGF